VEAIVVADVTFMSHADSDAVKARGLPRGEGTRIPVGGRFVLLRGGSAALAERTAQWIAGDRGMISIAIAAAGQKRRVAAFDRCWDGAVKRKGSKTRAKPGAPRIRDQPLRRG
jgi:hypothetical protein